MAPEVSKGRYDSGVDIYALGVMLFEMLTGTPPFVGDSIGEVLMKHLNEEPDLSRVEEPFRSVIKRAMAKNPDERYASAAEMVEDVYGSQSVQNSVVGFNPQELTMVAGRAAAQARVAVGGGKGPQSPVGFESGDASAWKRNTDPSRPISVAVMQDTDAPTNTVVAGPGRPKISLWYEVDKGQELAKDPLPVSLRYALGFSVAAAASIASSAGLDGYVFGYVMCVICGAVLAISLIRDNYLRHLSQRNQLLPRVLLCGVVVAIPLLGSMLDPNFSGWEAHGILGLLPLIVLNVHRLIHARRERRIRIMPVAIAGLIAIVLGSFLRTTDYYVAPMAIAGGSVLALQIVSPFRSPAVNGA